MTKKRLFLLGLFTLLFFPFLAVLIHYSFFDHSFLNLFYTKTNYFYEFIIGSVVGVLVALFGWRILNSKLLKVELNKYSKLFTFHGLSSFLIVFVSLSAGIGEEILFRGVIQPLIGIEVTAILFVAIHGYINPKNIRLSFYGVYMIISIVVVGYMSDIFGLISAITAHTFIDIVLLYKTKVYLKSQLYKPS